MSRPLVRFTELTRDLGPYLKNNHDKELPEIAQYLRISPQAVARFEKGEKGMGMETFLLYVAFTATEDALARFLSKLMDRREEIYDI